MDCYNDYTPSFFRDMRQMGNSGTMLPSPAGGAVMPSFGGASQGLPAFPSGAPTGPAYSPMAPGAMNATPSIPAAPPGEQSPTTVQSAMYTPGYLRTQIGRRCRVEFLVGTNGLTDRTGTLIGVGASYILLRPLESDDIMLCDIYSIKFVTFFY